MKVKVLLSHVQFFATQWTAAHQAPLSTGFSRQEYCSGLPFLSPGRIQPWSPALQADSLPFKPSGKHHLRIHYVNRHIAYRLLDKYRIMP